jgi:hypothetical protein
MRNGWMGSAVRWAVVVAMAVGASAAIGKNEGNGNGNGRDDADKRDKDRRECPDGRELTLANGRIHLLDAANSVVSSVTIRNGKFVSVGHDNGGGGTPGCRQLRQPRRPDRAAGSRRQPQPHRAARPAAGLAHAARDGGIVRRHRRDLPATDRGAPAGAFITTIGGFNPVQFAEKRLPTLAELDAIAPANPVYLQVSFTGPAATNTLGRAFFQSRGIAVSAEGAIAANAPTVAALNALRAVQTFADKKRGTLDALAYSAALGVTTNFDMGGFLIPGSPDHEDEFTFDGAASWDPYTAYDPMLDVYREGPDEGARADLLPQHGQRAGDADPVAAPQQCVPRIRRRLDADRGLGEFITNWPLFGAVVPPSNYPAAVRKAAERGWIYSQHTLSSARTTSRSARGRR